MKKLLYILLLLPIQLFGTDYYVRTDGSNSNNGLANTSGGAWLTLSYAASQVSAGSHTIHVGAGTFAESSQIVVATGVNIDGAGIASTFVTSSVASALMVLNSSEGTNGNQSITDIAFDGNLTSGSRAIEVNGRSNVKIYNCKFDDFLVRGVLFNACDGWCDYGPTTWATGNEFHDNVMNNCAEYVPAGENGWGNLNIGGQTGFLCYNNTITQDDRTWGEDGYCIKFYSYGYNKGLKIYNNTITNRPPAGPRSNGGPAWGLSIELWNSTGLEIYGNTIQGTMDIVRATPGTYSFGANIHHNTIGYDALVTSQDEEGESGMYIEDYNNDVYIYNNLFKHLTTGIWVDVQAEELDPRTSNNFYIYCNIFDAIGSSLEYKGAIIKFRVDYYTNYFNNWNIWNNTAVADGAAYLLHGIMLPRGIATNVSVKNNIISGFPDALYLGTGGSMDVLSVQNNDFHNNSIAFGITPTSYTNANNITSSPGFVSASDFHLNTGSGNIGTGIDVDLVTDYEDNFWNATPSIGAYEYNATIPEDPPGLPVLTTTAVTGVSSVLAYSGGSISENGSAVLSKGVCWSTTINPTIADSKTNDGSGALPFTSTLYPLVKNTTYHVRAYATNAAGTSYGQNISFTTSNFSLLQFGGFIITKDGIPIKID